VRETAEEDSDLLHQAFPWACGCLTARCRQAGFASIQFNAVVESNQPAVHLWQSLGFQIIGTVPESFDHPEHGLVGLHVMFRRL
jgi:hypothetical protein